MGCRSQGPRRNSFAELVPRSASGLVDPIEASPAHPAPEALARPWAAQSCSNSGTISRILRLRIGQRWPGDGMPKWEVIFARSLSSLLTPALFVGRKRFATPRCRRGRIGIRGGRDSLNTVDLSARAAAGGAGAFEECGTGGSCDKDSGRGRPMPLLVNRSQGHHPFGDPVVHSSKASAPPLGTAQK